jgi:hypothetical protein
VSRTIAIARLKVIAAGAAAGGIAIFVAAIVFSLIGASVGAGGNPHAGGPRLGSGAQIASFAGAAIGALLATLSTTGTEYSGPRVHVGVLLGPLAIAVFAVVGAARHVRTAACARAVHEIRVLGAEFPIPWDSPLRSGGCDELIDLLHDERASPDTRVAAGLGVLRFSPQATDHVAAVGELFQAPRPGRDKRLAILGQADIHRSLFLVERGVIGGWVWRALDDSDPAVALAAWKVAPDWIQERPDADRYCARQRAYAVHDEAAVRALAFSSHYMNPCHLRLQFELIARGLRDDDVTVRRAAFDAAESAENRARSAPEAAASTVARGVASLLADPSLRVRLAALKRLKDSGEMVGLAVMSTAMRCASQPDAVRDEAARLVFPPPSFAATDRSRRADWRAVDRERPARRGELGCP